VSEQEQQLLKRQVAARLEEHRRRRPQGLTLPTHQNMQPALPGLETTTRRTHGSRVADSVAARFARTVSYREFLQHEAEAATRQAEATAEIARRNAEAIAQAQQCLLEEIDQWNRAAETMETQAHNIATPTLATSAVEPARIAEPVIPAPSPSGFTVDAPVPPQVRSAPQPAPAAPRQAKRSATALTSTARPDFAAVLAEAMQTAPAQANEQQLSADEIRFSPSLLEQLAGPPEPTTGLPTNLIEFPRQLVAARKARPRIAEGPLREEADAAPERAQLRIFEVEANAFSTVPTLAAAESVLPEWSSIRLDSRQASHYTAQPDAQVSFALPLHTAPVSQRCMAAAVDACCIATAFLLAVAAAAYASPELPTGKFALGAAAGTLVLFGVLYLLVFFSFAEATPGMRYARIGLCTFSDENPTRKAMRQRLFAMALAAVPLGLGFAWAFLDDDQLGWHDRISRMYQRAY